MRKKLIEILNNSPYRPRSFTWGLIADHLIANGVVIAKKETTTWIPVTERLPEKEGRYLCVVRIGKSGAVYVRVMNGDSYGFSLDHIYDDDVTHWMPLPEPPKGE